MFLMMLNQGSYAPGKSGKVREERNGQGKSGKIALSAEMSGQVREILNE